VIRAMKRRDFLSCVAAATPLIAGSTAPLKAQSAGDPAKLARISIMTYNYTSRLKLPGQPPGAERTIAVLDIPQMWVDTWGIHNVEFQHSHFESTETSYLMELRARIAKLGSKMTQINVEFGQMSVSAPSPVQRDQAIDLTMRWVDHAAILNCPRVMINQGQLSQANMAATIAALRRITDYAKTKDVKISVETRLPGPGENAGSRNGTMEWEFVKELVEGGGAYSNVDIGNLMATDQAALHTAIKSLLPSNSGNMHIKVSPNWDLATAIRYTNNDLGYKGLYSIEVDPPLIRGVFNTILANI
jgi:sugar phosphate isomerase/epimerase